MGCVRNRKEFWFHNDLKQKNIVLAASLTVHVLAGHL